MNKVRFPEDTSFELISLQECIEACIANDFFGNKCKLNSDNITKEEIFIANIQKDIENYKLSIIKSKS